jgi:sterol desaturase/sphingolipid hydroxylase (fatty acid hydroxylase superfamily)
VIPFAAFWGLALTTRRAARTAADWALDLSGLFMQGWVVPLLGAWLFGQLLPGSRGTLSMPMGASFLLNFVLVDYLYYWNHRLLHGPLWRFHAVHHTAEQLDVWVTSRNGLLTPFFIVYIWVNGLFVHLLADPRPFLLSAALTAALDVWKHSGVQLDVPGLITPDEHRWHHSRERQDVFFGANLKLWDVLHGTTCSTADAPKALGVPLDRSFARKLI